MAKLIAIVLLFTSCVLTARPIDIIGGSPYCEPVNQDVWRCRDDYMRPWYCVNRHGRWQCWRTR